MDVRRPPPAAALRHRVGARLDGAQLDEPVLTSYQARGAIEIRILRRIMGVVRVDVFARGIAVPHLHHGAGDRRTILVDYAGAKMDQLAEGPFRAVSCEIATQR